MDGRTGDYQVEPVPVRAVDTLAIGISHDQGMVNPATRRQLTEAGVTPRTTTWTTRTRQTWDPRTGEQISEVLSNDSIATIENLGRLDGAPASSNVRIANLQLATGADGTVAMVIPRRVTITPVSGIPEIRASDAYGGARAGEERVEVLATGSTAPAASGGRSRGGAEDVMGMFQNARGGGGGSPVGGGGRRGRKKGRRQPDEELLTEMEGQTAVAPPPVLVMR